MTTPFPTHRIRSLVAPCLALLPATTLAAQTTTQATRQAIATEHPFLWRVEGRGGQRFAVPSWLYGTMHWGDERLVALPAAVEKARASADAVYCETVMGRSESARRALQSKMRLPEGRTLKDLLPAELYRRLSVHVVNRGVEMRSIDRLQIWAANMSLDWVAVAREKMNRRLDAMIWADAKAGGKEVGGLETPDEQLSGRAAMSREDQIKMLDLSLDYMERLAARGVGPIGRLLDVYLGGDETEVMALVNDVMGKDQELLMKALTRDRNVRMAERMATMMAEHPRKSYFFAVGVLHYLDDHGIVELLRSKGYRIQRVGAPAKMRVGTQPDRAERRRRWL